MKAEAILAIPLSEPERLFRDREEIRSEHRALQKFWHPDVNKDPLAARVFAHIEAMAEAAAEKARTGMWQFRPNHVEIVGVDGKRRKLHFRLRRPFELGEVLIGTRLITYLVERRHEDLVLSGLRSIGNLRYPNKNFRESLERYMPKVEKMFETSTHVCVMVRKDADDVLVSDLTRHLGGRVEPVHVAWMVSSMLNLLSYLEINSLTHNGLEPGTVWVNPRQHSASLHGGWWYSADVGAGIKVLPPWTHGHATGFLRAKKKADPQLDLDCVRAVARHALGDESGGGLRMLAGLPAAMRDFLMAPSGRSAIEEYGAWERAREAAFGERRFRELKVTGSEVYPLEEN